MEPELASVSPVKEMRLHPAAGFENLFPLGMEIEVSTNRLEWRTVFTNSDYTAEPGVPLVAVFPVVPVKYIRLTVTETAVNANGYHYAVIPELKAVHAEAVPGTVTVSWTAGGDDGAVGTADAYDLRVGACPFDFDTATSVATEAPDAAGSPEIARIRALCRDVLHRESFPRPVDLSGRTG